MLALGRRDPRREEGPGDVRWSPDGRTASAVMTTEQPGGYGPGQPPTPGYGQQPIAPPSWNPAPPAPPVTVRRERRGLGIFGTVLVAGFTAALVGAVAGIGGYVIGKQVDDTSGVSAVPASSSPVSLPQATGAPVVREPGSIGSIVATALPSVVSILAEGSSESGSGSGFVLRPDGYIITNNHVVDLVVSGGKLTVVFSDGSKAEGTIVGRNPEYDVAVVKVERTGLVPITLGDSDAVEVGDPVIAIGAPLGLEGTVTSGIVSAKDRPVTAGGSAGSGETAYINAIQTDAAINPGNSGGPLLDGAGHVVGINSAIASLANGSEAGSIGLGFAIPANSAKRIAEEIISTGDSSTPIIGVSLDLAYDGDGARVSEVNKGGPSDTAGIKPGDIITRLDGRSINDSTELVVAIRSHAPGDVVDLEFTRGGQSKQAKVTLGTASGNR